MELVCKLSPLISIALLPQFDAIPKRHRNRPHQISAWRDAQLTPCRTEAEGPVIGPIAGHAHGQQCQSHRRCRLRYKMGLAAVGISTAFPRRCFEFRAWSVQ
jgi:hypothetical protein